MKFLSQFNSFNFQEFAKSKRFMAIGCSPWNDFDSGECLGTKVEAVIVTDNTEYKRKDGDTSTNQYEKLSFKVNKPNLDIPKESLIMPVNVEASIWGEFKNQLSVKCEDIQVAQRKG